MAISGLGGVTITTGFCISTLVGGVARSPNDPRDRNTPNPPQPKDEFVLKFVKP